MNLPVALTRREEAAPVVIVDLPIPGGFAIQGEDLAQLVEEGRIARFQVTPRSAVVYLRGLEPGEPLKLEYRLRATMPVKVQAAPAVVYEYYNPDRRGATRGVQLVAVP